MNSRPAPKGSAVAWRSALGIALALSAALPGAAAPKVPAGSKALPVLATFEIQQGRENATPVATGVVHGVRRVEGGTVLYYSLGFPERFGRDASFVSVRRATGTSDRWGTGNPWAAPELIDAADRRAYTTLVDKDNGTCLCSVSDATEDKAGKLYVLYSTYPPLPPGTRKVNVVIGFGIVVTNVPVLDGALEPAVAPTKPILVGDGWPRVDLAGMAAAPDKELSVRDLVTSVVDFANQITTVESPGQVSVELSADVLFAVDSASLTPQAQASIDKVAATVNERASAGIVRVVGHTDSTGDDSHNDMLSQQRAASVRSALEPLVKVAGMQFEVEGRGEREPIADNGSEAGRQANRRVTVTFAPRG